MFGKKSVLPELGPWLEKAIPTVTIHSHSQKLKIRFWLFLVRSNKRLFFLLYKPPNTDIRLALCIYDTFLSPPPSKPRQKKTIVVLQ